MGRYHRVSGMLWKHDGCWVSWEAEVIFRQWRASSASASCGAAPAEALEKRVYGAEGLEIATQCRKDRSGHNVIVMWDNSVRMTLGQPWIKKV